MLNKYWYRGRIRPEYRKSRRRNEALAERRSAIACSQIPTSSANYSTRRIQTSYRIYIVTIYAMGKLWPRNAIRNFGIFFKISVFTTYMYCICSMISYGTRFSVHCRASWKMLLRKFGFYWGKYGSRRQTTYFHYFAQNDSIHAIYAFCISNLPRKSRFLEILKSDFASQVDLLVLRINQKYMIIRCSVTCGTSLGCVSRLFAWFWEPDLPIFSRILRSPLLTTKCLEMQLTCQIRHHRHESIRNVHSDRKKDHHTPLSWGPYFSRGNSDFWLILEFGDFRAKIRIRQTRGPNSVFMLNMGPEYVFRQFSPLFELLHQRPHYWFLIIRLPLEF